MTNEQRKLCEGELTENEIFDALTGIDNNKSPGNDGLTKEFYRTFWNYIKNDYMSSLKESRNFVYLTKASNNKINRKT